jgi:hypothetical protein
MIQSIGTDAPTHFPFPMSRFGLNPHGAPMWRIVFTDSVKRLIGGRWNDGVEEYRLARVYTGPGAKNKWVLESWISAQEHTGCTAEEYPIKFQATGCVTTIQNEPYPYDGTYVQRHIFAGEPSGIEQLIAKWHAERDIGWAERRRMRQEVIDYDAKKTKESELYRLRECQPDPNGSMMIKRRRAINPRPASDFKLPGSGFSQVQGA